MLAMYISCPLTWNWRSFSVCAWDNSGSSGAAILPRQSSSKAYQRPPSFPGASRAAAACASYRRLAVRMTLHRWPRESDTEKISICSLYWILPGCSCGFAPLVFFCLIWSVINLRFIGRQNIFHMCCTESLCSLHCDLSMVETLTSYKEIIFGLNDINEERRHWKLSICKPALHVLLLHCSSSPALLLLQYAFYHQLTHLTNITVEINIGLPAPRLSTVRPSYSHYTPT